MELENLIAECTAYDFKLMLEEKKPKSWLKSVSAFANGFGGSLFFGIDNDGILKGLDNLQYVCETISSKIRDYMDPLPEVEMIPHRIDNLDIAEVSSERRNPILANVMAQLNYMEKRGSGLTRICNETKALDGYKDELKPVFKSTPTQFQTIIFASGEKQNVGDFVGDMSETKLTERQQKILNLIKESTTISAKQMSETLSVTTRTIERDLSLMKKAGVLKREGKDNNGRWIVIESLLR